MGHSANFWYFQNFLIQIVLHLYFSKDFKCMTFICISTQWYYYLYFSKLSEYFFHTADL